jgi:hypothetical protein
MYPNYRHINTIKYKFLIPSFDELLDKFQGAIFFSKLYLPFWILGNEKHERMHKRNNI